MKQTPGKVSFHNTFFKFKRLYTAKLVPQPQVLLALGFLNVKPLLFKPFIQSTSMPARYNSCALFIIHEIPSISNSRSFAALLSNPKIYVMPEQPPPFTPKRSNCVASNPGSAISLLNSTIAPSVNVTGVLIVVSMPQK